MMTCIHVSPSTSFIEQTRTGRRYSKIKSKQVLGFTWIRLESVFVFGRLRLRLISSLSISAAFRFPYPATCGTLACRFETKEETRQSTGTFQTLHSLCLPGNFNSQSWVSTLLSGLSRMMPSNMVSIKKPSERAFGIHRGLICSPEPGGLGDSLKLPWAMRASSHAYEDMPETSV